MFKKYTKVLEKQIAQIRKNIKKYSDDLGKNKKKRYVLTATVVVLFLLILAYANMGLFVAATVNGQPISRLKLIKELEKQGGKQVLDGIVTETLIQQEAKNKNITVAQEDIDMQLEEIVKSLESQGTDLDTALAMQGQTKDDLINSLKLRIMAEKLLLDRVSIADDEIKNYYEDNKSTYPEGSKFEDLKSDIENNLKQQKLSEEYQKWIAEIKQTAKINTLIVF